MDYSDWAPRDVRALISAGKPLHFAEGTGL